MSIRAIKDIRLYEGRGIGLAGPGESNPTGLGDKYTVINSKKLNLHLMLFTRKLHELGFTLDGFDHIYLNFNTGIEPNTFQLSEYTIAKWMRYIDCGLGKDEAPVNDEANNIAYWMNLIFDTLRWCINGDSANAMLLKRAIDEYGIKGTNMVIVHKKKETKSYMASVCFQVNESDYKSTLILRYEDKALRWKAEKLIQDLIYVTDVHDLTGKIIVKGKAVEIHPLQSSRTEVLAKRYNIPIIVPIEVLSQATVESFS